MATKGLGYNTPKFPVLRAGGLLNELHSETLNKAVEVSEAKIQERSRRRGRFSGSHFPCRKKSPNLGRDSISCCRKIGEEFSAVPEKFSSKEFRTATAFSSFLFQESVCAGLPYINGPGPNFANFP